MKKFFTATALVITLIVLLAWPYMAVGQKSVQLSELNMNFKLPGNALLLTREADRSGLPLDMYKLLKRTDIDAEFKKADIYMQAKYQDFEIQVDAFADFGTAFLFDLDKLTKEQLQEVLLSFAEMYQGDKVSLYKPAGTTYILVEYRDKKLGDSYTTHSYMTIKNGRLINIALICPDKQSTATRTDKLKRVVDSITYIKK
mgnify:CR=1 FL=1